jgi:hypothetical protein
VRSALVRQALVQRESAKRLAALGGCRSLPRSGAAAAACALILADRSVWVEHLRTGQPRNQLPRLDATHPTKHPTA